MRFTVPLLSVLGTALTAISPLRAAESPPVTKPGIRELKLVTDIQAITPGKPFTIALVIDPQAGYHTYWRGPGIVGVATAMKWTLPEGFTAGAIQWPAPQKVNMAGITAYGYRERTLLLTKVTPPKEIAGNEVTLQVKCIWMACATSCNPGLAELSLTLPVQDTGKPEQPDAKVATEIEAVRTSLPPSAPSSWKIVVRSPSAVEIALEIEIPDLKIKDTESVYFYSDDMQVDSDEPQAISLDDAGRLQLRLVRPEFAPRSPDHLSGLLFCSQPWPGLNSHYVEISAPWPAGTFPHE
ncbi:MAG: hypothetical protein KBF76_02610 [Verrucomicrobiales bacterium]|nr:hypothetical protein [Verrucomicrobiales bacterium]